MKKNKGLTLVELIIVMACLGMVTLFFWTILSSSSEDAYTLTDKVMVQNSVTSLMNTIQKDVQEAKIVTTKIQDKKNVLGILSKEMVANIENENIYFFNANSSTEYEDSDVISIGQIHYNDDTVKYEFNKANKTVTRTQGKDENVTVAVYDNIVAFSISKVNEGKYGVTVKIVGGKMDIDTAEHDRSRYELNSTFYTRNTQ